MNLQEQIRKVLKEEINKKQSILKLIEEYGLYDFMGMSGLSLPQINGKVGNPPREVKIQYLKDLIVDREQEPNLFDVTFYTGAIPLWTDETNDTKGYVEFLSNNDNILRVHVSIWNKYDDEITEDYQTIDEEYIDDETLDILVNELSEKLQHQRM